MCVYCMYTGTCLTSNVSAQMRDRINRSGFCSVRSAVSGAGNEFQEAEHANKFIIPTRFRSNYHFASKAIQDPVCSCQIKPSVNSDKYLHKRKCTRWASVTARNCCGHVGLVVALPASTYIMSLRSRSHVSDGPIASRIQGPMMRSSTARPDVNSQHAIPFMRVSPKAALS